MSETITSYVGATPSTDWPFVSVPDFDRRGKRARHEAYIEMIGFSPLVTYEERHRWAIFSAYDHHEETAETKDTIKATIGNAIYRVDEETGQRIWMETVTPLREIQDPARALGRLEACELSKLHIEQIRAGKAQGGVFLRDAERVRDRHCDR